MPEGCWYELVLRRAEAGLRSRSRPTRWRQVWRCAKAGRRRPARSTARAAETGRAARMAHARCADRAPPRRARSAPSDAGERRAAPLSPGAASATRRLLRGSLVHRLLQSLPDIRRRRGGRGGATLISPAPAKICRPSERAENRRAGHARARRCALLRAFRAGSRAEVPIVGSVSVGGERCACPARSTVWP